MARAWDFGHKRLLAGIHYFCDIEMGRIWRTVIAATIMRQDDFKAEYGAAKAELLAASGKVGDAEWGACLPIGICAWRPVPMQSVSIVMRSAAIFAPLTRGG
jgi:hypothetical protein